jgi:hypothetical protein
MRIHIAHGLVALVIMPIAAHSEAPIKVTMCEVLQNPAAYNHKLIEISGSVSRGSEDFTFHDQECQNPNMIWLELGGTTGSRVMYCCGVTTNPKRSAALKVDGIETTLVEDETFARFEKMTSRPGGYGTARVTVIGRCLSGRKQKLPGGTFWMGYGHMGMATLLVIQQVLDVAP